MGTELKKLPLVIDNEIFLRSLEQKTLKTKSKILGARHGDFILIEEPVFQVNERLYSTPEGFLCTLLHEDELYSFQSKIQKSLAQGLTFIDYPSRFHVEVIRKHHRIQVDIEVRFLLGNSKSPARGTILNISEGGCFVNIPVLVPAIQNMMSRIDFVLPDGQDVSGVQAKIRQIQFYKLKNTTELGLQFIGPPEQLAKVSSFCQYCMFFKA